MESYGELWSAMKSRGEERKENREEGREKKKKREKVLLITDHVIARG